MTRIELIQGLIDKHGYKTYLEIGVNTPKQPGYSHDSIQIAIKEGVDPNVDTTYKMPSDVFFRENSNKYDIIFIDGDHTYEQCYRDIVNSLAILNEGGTIVVHDCIPHNEMTQRVPRETDAWHGDVWRSILRLRMEEYDLEIYTVDTDEGCAIIRRGKQELLAYGEHNYPYFEKHRKEILNEISVNEFKNKEGL